MRPAPALSPPPTGVRGRAHQRLADIAWQRPRSGATFNAIALVDGQPGAALPTIEGAVAARFVGAGQRRGTENGGGGHVGEIIRRSAG